MTLLRNEYRVFSCSRIGVRDRSFQPLEQVRPVHFISRRSRHTGDRSFFAVFRQRPLHERRSSNPPQQVLGWTDPLAFPSLARRELPPGPVAPESVRPCAWHDRGPPSGLDHKLQARHLRRLARRASIAAGHARVAACGGYSLDPSVAPRVSWLRRQVQAGGQVCFPSQRSPAISLPYRAGSPVRFRTSSWIWKAIPSGGANARSAASRSARRRRPSRRSHRRDERVPAGLLVHHADVVRVGDAQRRRGSRRARSPDPRRTRAPCARSA